MRTPDIGEVVGDKYVVKSVLGQGGMGVVLEAHHRVLGELVALKFFRAALHDKPQLLERFVDEARAGIRIKSEHVARIYDVGTFEGAPFIAMERLHGQDLAALLRERGALPLAEVVDYLLEACEALAEAHLVGIVHRDIKPGNLYLAKGAGGLSVVKVLDFGIASYDDAGLATSARAGSPRYMAPEQVTGGPVDARVDLWALGVLAYELLTGSAPFDADTVEALHLATLSGRYTPLSLRCPGVPAEVENIVADALKLAREERIASVEAFASRLAKFGTPAATMSLARIQRLVQPPADETADPKPVDPDALDASRTAPGHGTLTAAPMAVTKPPARRWTPWLLAAPVVVAAAAAGLGVARTSAGHDGGDPSSATSASSEPSARASLAAPSASAASACAGGATTACEEACKAGRPGACHELGKALERGVGTKADPARAAIVYQAECEGGGPLGCNNLGTLYARGVGVPHDDERAVALYKKACDGGSGTGCVNLGSMHFEGTGLPKDPQAGARLYLLGCEMGEPRGCQSLSVAYARGEGALKDPVEALAMAKRACAAGVKIGCVRVSKAKLTGEGVPKDVKAGLGELDQMCTDANGPACVALMGIYVKGLPGDVSADGLRTRMYAAKACKLGEKDGCAAESALSTIDRTSTTPAQLLHMFDTQCKAGNAAACGVLGKPGDAGGRR